MNFVLMFYMNRRTYLSLGHNFFDSLSKCIVANAFGANDVWNVSGVWFWKIESFRMTARLKMATTCPMELAILSNSSQPASVVTSCVEMRTSAPYDAHALINITFLMSAPRNFN